MHIVAVKKDFSTRGLKLCANHFQQRCFTGTTWSHYSCDKSAWYIDVHAVENALATAHEMEIFDLHQRIRHTAIITNG